jgi:hypothetical protein
MRTHAVENLTSSNLVLCGGQFRIPAGKVGYVPDSLWGHSDLVLALAKGQLKKYKPSPAPVAAPVPEPVPEEPPVESVTRRRGRPRRSDNDEDKDNAG